MTITTSNETMTEDFQRQASPESAKRMCAINVASLVAKKSKVQEKAKSANEYAKIEKSALEFQKLAIQAQLKFLDDLASLSDEGQLDTLFFLLDKHDPTKFGMGVRGFIHAEHLADGLRKVRGDEEFEKKIALALEKVSHYEQEGHGQLNFDCFQKYIQTVNKMIGCTIYEVLELLVLNVLFSTPGPHLGEIVDELNSDAVDISTRKNMDDRKRFKRMKTLFDMFDYYHDDKIQFKEVVLGLYKITQDVAGTTKAAISALMTFSGHDDLRSMNFEQFARFINHIIDISEADPSIDTLTLDYIADAMTKNVAINNILMTPDQIAQLFALDTSLKEVLYISDATEGEVETACDETIYFGKANRLFDMWDLDRDGYINFHDLALGLRKLEETTSLKKTVEEAEQILQHFDVDHDNRLNTKEFFYFLYKFCEKIGKDVGEIIDFMIVASILKEHKIKDIECMGVFSYGIDGPEKTEADLVTYG